MKFAITRQLQIILCLLGQSKVFGEASELLEKLLGIPISGMQIHRVCDYYGDKVDKAITRNKEISIGKLQDVKKEDNVYVMVDGSMLLTRDEKWKEVKLARIINARKMLKMSDSRSEIVE